MTANNFAPIFVVGPPRSGTTMLAVLLDRHSRISIPPETEFFSRFLPQLHWDGLQKNRKKMVDLALSFNRIADLKLDSDIVLKRFESLENTFPNLLRAILDAYTEKCGKVRQGEKTPLHLEHVPTILKSYPDAKVICILRDGRDIVESLLKTPWAHPGNLRRFGLSCREWTSYIRLAIHYKQAYSPEQFYLVKYENIVLKPQFELKKLLDFVGEKFEPTQLDPGVESAVVPAWENAWKANATTIIDRSRVEAWRKIEDKEKIWTMNYMMGPMLKRMGYADVNLNGCPFLIKIKIAISSIPYLRPLRLMLLISLLGLKIFRFIKAFLPKDNSK